MRLVTSASLHGGQSWLRCFLPCFGFNYFKDENLERHGVKPGSLCGKIKGQEKLSGKLRFPGVRGGKGRKGVREPGMGVKSDASTCWRSALCYSSATKWKVKNLGFFFVTSLRRCIVAWELFFLSDFAQDSFYDLPEKGWTSFLPYAPSGLGKNPWCGKRFD